MYKKDNKGFTLIELLVVIAIIGILSGVVLTSLNGARGKARTAAAESTARGILPAAIVCADIPEDLDAPEDDNLGGGNICSSEDAEWPPLPTTGGWSYTMVDTAIASDDSDNFSFTVSDGTITITCNEVGCTK
jgi:prepilin-type N-terminal cleavage/methylation domain-containing protein